MPIERRRVSRRRASSRGPLYRGAARVGPGRQAHIAAWRRLLRAAHAARNETRPADRPRSQAGMAEARMRREWTPGTLSAQRNEERGKRLRILPTPHTRLQLLPVPNAVGATRAS